MDITDPSRLLSVVVHLYELRKPYLLRKQSGLVMSNSSLFNMILLLDENFSLFHFFPLRSLSLPILIHDPVFVRRVVKVASILSMRHVFSFCVEQRYYVLLLSIVLV